MSDPTNESANPAAEAVGNEPLNENQVIENEAISAEEPQAEPLGETAALQAELELKKTELATARAEYLRLMAEFDNFRKRNARERADLIEYAGADVLKALLPILDDFQRTLTAIEKTDNLASIREGIGMVSLNLNKILEKQGLVAIESKGLAFDSSVHEAIGSFEAEEEKKGFVLEEAERGYKLKDKVIRYAKVIVGE